jgi:hypothetical protein
LFMFYEANARAFSPRRTGPHGRPLYASVYRSAKGIEIRFEDESPPADPPGLSRLWDVGLFQDVPRKRAAWWPTREVTELRLSSPGSLTAGEQSAMLPALVAAFDRQPDREQMFLRSASLARAGVWSTSTPIPSGYVRNGISLLALSWLLVGGFFAGREATRLIRERGRRSRGECPKCGFDLAGLEGRPCPECGSGDGRGPQA